MDFIIPAPAARALSMLREAGYEAVPVGGCVRDTLLGGCPHDWDLATSATPEEMLAVFSDCRVLPIGLRHGTLTVLLEQTPVELTTYRADGDYSDGRHPDAVRFSRSLADDLSRRDFTINALALTPDGAVLDLFGGQADLSRRLLRAVGDPDRRFTEDALRILRALRFAAQLGLAIEPATADSLRRNAGRLSVLSAERVCAELTRLLCAPDCARILIDYAELLYAALPGLMPEAGAPAERSRLERCWAHGAAAAAAAPATPALRWAALLHDAGKLHPGAGPHAAAGARLADELLRRLKSENAVRRQVVWLIAEHDRLLSPDRVLLRRRVARQGAKKTQALLALQRADALACRGDWAVRRLETLDAADRLLSALLDEAPALGLDTLALGGAELLALGVPAGPPIGLLLHRLLDAVIDERLPNDRAALLDAAQKELEQWKKPL